MNENFTQIKCKTSNIDKNVFSGALMTIHLCDQNMKMFKNIGYIQPVPDFVPTESK